MDEHGDRRSTPRRFVRWIGIALVVVAATELAIDALQIYTDPWRPAWLLAGATGASLWFATRSRERRGGRSALEMCFRGVGTTLVIFAGWSAITVAVGFDWSLAGTAGQYPDLSRFTLCVLLFMLGLGSQLAGDYAAVRRDSPQQAGSDPQS